MKRPRVRDLSPRLVRAARGIAEALAAAGARGWIVGGTVRDLALGRSPREVDMASALPPEAVAKLFPRTASVGARFGTVVVATPDAAIELTTFRTESSYSDGRRPDRVRYGASVAEDAARRDFTCNALFLDPLTDELVDPMGGLGDLESGVLRAVGDARARFEEDGLRLLRMARFEGNLVLRPAEGLHDAARAARRCLSAISRERVRAELVKLFELSGAARGVEVMRECGLLEEALPGWRAAAGGERERLEDLRLAALRALPDPPGVLAGMAVLLDVDPLEAASQEGERRVIELAEGLRLSRAERDACAELWRGRRELREVARRAGPPSERILLLRPTLGPLALELAEAWATAAADVGVMAHLRELREWFEALPPERVRPKPWIDSSDLESAGVERGPRWGALLRRAEALQLDGTLNDREQALAWLRAQV